MCSCMKDRSPFKFISEGKISAYKCNDSIEMDLHSGSSEKKDCISDCYKIQSRYLTVLNWDCTCNIPWFDDDVHTAIFVITFDRHREEGTLQNSKALLLLLQFYIKFHVVFSKRRTCKT